MDTVYYIIRETFIDMDGKEERVGYGVAACDGDTSTVLASVHDCESDLDIISAFASDCNLSHLDPGDLEEAVSQKLFSGL